MKKILLVLMLAIAANYVSAQDFKKLQNTILLQKWEDAKTEVDKLSNDTKAKDKPEFYHYKARVYSVLFKEPTLRAKYPNAGDIAADALEKYGMMDIGYKNILALTGSAVSFFDLYDTHFEIGKALFNDSSWSLASENFLKSIKYIDTIIKYKWMSDTTIKIDSRTLLYLGACFQNIKQKGDAARYYQIIADKKLNDPSLLFLYQFLLEYFLETKDESKYNKYLSYGRELFTNYDWSNEEFQFIKTNYDILKTSTLYDTEDSAGKLTEQKYVLFGDLFNNVRNTQKELDSLTQVKYTLKAADAFKKAYQLNNANTAAIYNVGAIYLNIYKEYNDRINASRGALRAISSDNEDEFAAKKAAAKTPQAKAAVNKTATEKLAATQAPIKSLIAALEIELQKNMDIAIESLELTFNLLKDKTGISKRDNNILKNSVTYLGALYEVKRDKFRAKDLNQFDFYDAKVKEFDALYEKYKN